MNGSYTATACSTIELLTLRLCVHLVAKRNILTASASRSHTSQTPHMSVVGVGLSVWMKNASKCYVTWKCFPLTVAVQKIVCHLWNTDFHCIQNIWFMFRFFRRMNWIHTLVCQLLEIIWMLRFLCLFLDHAVSSPLQSCSVYVRSNIYTVRSLYFKKSQDVLYSSLRLL